MAAKSSSDRFKNYEYIPAATIEKVAHGDREAIEAVIDKYKNYMWVVLRNMVHKKSLRLNLLPVEDIKQTVWLCFISDLKKYRLLQNDASDIEKMFDSYCTKVLHHIIRDTLKRFDTRSAGCPIFSMEILSEFPDKSPDLQIEKIRVNLEDTNIFLNNEKLAEAILRLRPKYRKVIELAFFLDYTDTDIAECLKIKKKSVYQYKYEALNLLKKEILSK